MKKNNTMLNLKNNPYIAMWCFPALYFDLLTNEIEGKHTKQTC